MTPATLSRVGTALYGPLWQTQLSRAIGVNDRSVRRWLTEEMPIPDGIREELVKLIHKRRAELLETLKLLAD